MSGHKSFFHLCCGLIIIILMLFLNCNPEPRYESLPPQYPFDKTNMVASVSTDYMVKKEVLTESQKIEQYVQEICDQYGVDSALILSIIYHESRFDPEAKNGQCLGLMQVSEQWHSDRAKRLGVTDFHDPYGNILLGVDYIDELMDQYGDERLVLMLYNMRHDEALAMFKSGEISYYAKSVLKKAEEIREGDRR